jgi:hypothetical protein
VAEAKRGDTDSALYTKQARKYDAPFLHFSLDHDDDYDKHHIIIERNEQK